MFDEIEAEFKITRSQEEFEQLLFNHNRRVEALYGKQKSKFEATGTLERLFQKPIRLAPFGSDIHRKLFAKAEPQ